MSEHLPEVFRALADDTRLRIVHLLSSGELCVCDLMETLGAPQSKISRHLAYLRRAGIVQDRKDGLWRYYSLARPPEGLRRRVLDSLRRSFGESGALRRDAIKLSRLRAKAARCA